MLTVACVWLRSHLLGLEVPVQIDLLDRIDRSLLDRVIETLLVAHRVNVAHDGGLLSMCGLKRNVRCCREWMLL